MQGVLYAGCHSKSFFDFFCIKTCPVLLKVNKQKYVISVVLDTGSVDTRFFLLFSLAALRRVLNFVLNFFYCRYFSGGFSFSVR